MKGIHFWTLLIVSTAVSLLMIKQIFVSREIIRQQHALVDAHERADTGPVYKAAWEKLALAVWKASLQDPAMAQVLKDQNIAVHEGSPPGAPQTSTNAAPVQPAAPKPAPASHPATP
jgi:hypothetical protein